MRVCGLADCLLGVETEHRRLAIVPCRLGQHLATSVVDNADGGVLWGAAAC
jgi:hypothetical protein